MKQKNDAVIVALGRAPVARGIKGALAKAHPLEYAAQTLKGVLKQVPTLPTEEIGDLIVGCACPYFEQGDNLARLLVLRAGLPEIIPGQTINRLCSSSLQAIAACAYAIQSGVEDIMVAGGVESMSLLPMGSPLEKHNAWLETNCPGAYMSMGLTAENVAQEYGVSRLEMERMAMESHRRAAQAQDQGWFDDQIIPIELSHENGRQVVLTRDEGIRRETNLESLAKLKPCFKPDGRVTAATSSQISDSAAFVVLMSRRRAEELSIQPVAKFLGFAAVGVAPERMGVGPMYAVPKVMEQVGLTTDDMDAIELNEAFAAQAIPCIRELHLNPERVNPTGGAMALGHPLGATGCILTCKLISQLRRTGGRYGLVTMCVGGGMGAAGVFEMEGA